MEGKRTERLRTPFTPSQTSSERTYGVSNISSLISSCSWRCRFCKKVSSSHSSL